MARSEAIAVVLALAACAPRPLTPASTPSPPLLEAARAALLTRCGRCHDGRLETANPAALRIYDLSEPDWPVRMTAARYQGMLRRTAGFEEPGRGVVAAFVAEDLERLAAASR